jgi:uncharacterized membrane protein YbhN (UPF0104 family)
VVLFGAFGIAPSPSLAGLVVLSANVSLLMPGLPANLGTFEAAVLVALRSGGVEPATALGYALVYHALRTVPVTLLGLGGLLAWRRRGAAVAADHTTSSAPR